MSALARGGLRLPRCSTLRSSSTAAWFRSTSSTDRSRRLGARSSTSPTCNWASAPAPTGSPTSCCTCRWPFWPWRLLASGTRSRGGNVLAIIVVATACLALAVAVEFAQLFFPPRTVSQNDLIAEAIGTALGIAAWLFAGPRLLSLAHRLSWGGAHTWQALAALYAIAYVAYALFPFDFLLSTAELRAKLTESGRAAWLLADSCGGVVGCSVKLSAEIALAAPLGALAGLAFARLGVGAAFAIGIALGLAIETTQILLASGVSQGFSVLARGLGMAWGLALQHRFRLEWVTRHADLLRRALVLALPVYLLLLAVLNGFAGKLEPLWVARQKLAETRFLPFYYHYFTTETAALASLLSNAGAYAMVGVGLWLWNPARPAGGRSGVLALGIAFGIECLKLFLPGKRPDPTNLLIAFVAAALVNAMLSRLSAAIGAERPAPTSATPRQERSMRPWVLASVATIVAVIGGALLVASPNPERPVDESTMPQLPPGHELPAVSLPRFRAEHPRLPHPTPQDLATLAFKSPGYLRELRNQARGGKGAIEASALLELVEPGSIDLDALHGRLMALRFEWRGHRSGSTAGRRLRLALPALERDPAPTAAGQAGRRHRAHDEGDSAGAPFAVQRHPLQQPVPGAGRVHARALWRRSARRTRHAFHLRSVETPRAAGVAPDHGRQRRLARGR